MLVSVKKIFDGISKRAAELLAGDEGLNVDFKRTVKSVSADDLVSFANSETGGALLAGIEDTTDAKGRQRGKIVGCEVSDAMKLLVINRAFSCFPPVPIEIYIENNADIPFYRIEIESGESKPYCTASGTYKVREDGRNKILHPSELLNIFLKAESNQFIDRFKQAALEIHVDDRKILKKDVQLLHQKLNAVLKKLDIEKLD